MSKYGFKLLWSDEDQGFIATCPDFPGLSAFGESPAEALKEAGVALNLFIDSLKAHGNPLPKPTQAADHSGQIRLRMPKSLHSSLVQKAENEGVSLNTWIITLLAERNATAKLFDKVDKVATQIHSVEQAMYVQISQKANYETDFSKGDEYGKIQSRFN